MDLTPNQLAILNSIPSSNLPVEGGSNMLGRVGMSLANLPANIVEGVGQGLVNLAEWGTPAELRDKVSVPKFFNIPEATTLGEQVSDFLVGEHGLASIVGQTMIPAGVVGKVGKLAGMEGASLEALKFGAGFMVPEANREGATGTDVAVAGALGATTGPLGMLPMGPRAIGSAAIAAAHGLYETAQRGPTTGAIAAGADFITGLIPGPRPDLPIPSTVAAAEGVARNRRALRLPEHAYDSGAPIAPEWHPTALLEDAPRRPYQEIITDIPSGPPIALRSNRAAIEGREVPLELMPPGWRHPALEDAPSRPYTEILNELPTGQTIIPRPEVRALEGRAPVGLLEYPGNRPSVPDAAPLGLPGASTAHPDFATLQKPSFAGNVRPRQRLMLEERARADAPPPTRPVPEQGTTPRTSAEAPTGHTEAAPATAATNPLRTLSREEEQFANSLKARYTSFSDSDLRGLIDDLDNEIANSLDDASVSSYRLSRDVAASLLESRAKPAVASVAPPVGGSTATNARIRRTQRIGVTDELGGVNYGTVVDFDKTSVKVKFEGSSGTVTVPRQRVVTKDLPKKVATLQKGEGQAAKEAIDEEARAVRVGVKNAEKMFGTVGSADDALRAAEERIPGFTPRRSESLSEGWFHSKTEPGSRGTAKMPEAVEKTAAAAMDSIVNAVRTALNPDLNIRWKAGMDIGTPGSADFSGNIKLNIEYFAGKIKNWKGLSAAEKTEALVDLTRTVGHEGGHVALMWLRTEDPKMYQAILDEFVELTPEARLDIVSHYHKKLGLKNDYTTTYTAANPMTIADAYKIHPNNIEALNEVSLQEFFAEMVSAYTFGQLKQELIPKEMRTLWDKVKDIFEKMVASFKPSQWFGGDEAFTEMVAMNDFKNMLEETMTRFYKARGAEYKATMRKSKKLHDDLATGYESDNAVYRAMDQQGAVEGRSTRASNKRIEEEERAIREASERQDDNLDDFLGSFATLQKEGGFNMRLGGMATSQLTDEFGSAIAGAIIGGYAGPEFSEGQVSMAEGILLGGILGAFGPRAIKSLLSVPKSATGAFSHRSFADSLKQVFRGNTEGVAAEAAAGHGSSVAKFMRFLERNANLHLPREVFNAVVDADGPAAWALHVMDDAFKKARGFKETPAFTAATEAFLGGGDRATYLSALSSLGKEAQLAGNFYVTARGSIATLQKLFSEGLKDGPYKDMLLNSIKKGDYLTRQYKIFHDPKYQPTQVQVESVAQWFTAKNPSIGLTDARQVIEDYLHQIKTEGVHYRGSVSDVGKKLDAFLFSERLDLDPVFRDMLGQYVNPREKVFGTVQHLYNGAVTGKLLDNFSLLKDKHGLNYSYGLDEHSLVVEGLENAIRHGTVPQGKTIATLQNELDALKSYVPLDNQARYGKLSGKMVSRFVRDQLATFDSPWGLMDGSIMRSLTNFHNAVKIARAPLNPITVVRNIVAMPVLSVIGGANPLTDIPRAFKAIRSNPAMLEEMVRNGILGVDQIKGEMLRNVDLVRLLNADNSIFSAVQKGVNSALEFYRWPDMLVRASTYMSAKSKFAKELGLPDTHASVVAKARDWTNRYTVNYSNVSPMVKSLRQIPFTNLFISYTAEITRISKNLVEDVFKHPDMGQRVRALTLLGGLATIPITLEKASEQQLSKKDKKDWDKARELMPAYQRANNLVVMGREKDGRFRYLDITPLTQIDSLSKMIRSVASGDMKTLAASNPVVSWENTPALNIVTEQITGTDLRSGRPIDKNMLTRARAVIKEIVPPILPGGYEFKRVTEAFSPTEGGELGITNERTGRRVTPSDVVSSFLTGMRTSTADLSYLQRTALGEAKRNIANEAAYLRDVLQSDHPRNVKDKAIDRYRRAQEGILLQLTQKLQ